MEKIKGKKNAIAEPNYGYGDKRIEEEGTDWVLVREKDGTPSFVFFDSPEQKQSVIGVCKEPDPTE